MARVATLLLVALVGLILFHSAFGYVEMAMNRKSNLTVEDRFNQFKRTNSPLGGGMTRIGYYFVELTVGSQVFRVDIDTGSSTLYIVGPDCHYTDSRSTACSYAKSFYQGSAPYEGCDVGCDSCQKGVCIMHATYGDGSEVYGAVKQDTITIGSYQATGPAAISYLQSSDFASLGGGTYMDGLWGLAYPTFNGGLPTVVDKLVAAGMPNVFSMCFSTNGGYLVMGGINTNYHTGTVQYTPLTSQDYYAFGVNDVKVGSSSLGTSWPKTILDSGTTFAYVPITIYTAMKNALVNAGIDSGFFINVGDKPACVTQANLALKTSLSLNLPKVGGGSFDATLGPLQYTIDCGGGSRAFGFIPVADGQMAIIGDSFMSAFNNIFDRANAKIGLAPVSASCNGYVALNSQSYQVPGTKSQFSDAATVVPSILIVCLSVALFLFFN